MTKTLYRDAKNVRKAKTQRAYEINDKRQMLIDRVARKIRNAAIKIVIPVITFQVECFSAIVSNCCIQDICIKREFCCCSVDLLVDEISGKAHEVKQNGLTDINELHQQERRMQRIGKPNFAARFPNASTIKEACQRFLCLFMFWRSYIVRFVRPSYFSQIDKEQKIFRQINRHSSNIRSQIIADVEEYYMMIIR